MVIYDIALCKLMLVRHKPHLHLMPMGACGLCYACCNMAAMHFSKGRVGVEIVCPYFLQVPGTCWGVPLHPPGGARCQLFWQKRGGTWVPLQVPPHSLKNACQVG
jgi:hypothetical protein